MNGKGGSDEGIPVLGPIGEADAPRLVELEAFSLDNMTVAISEYGKRIA